MARSAYSPSVSPVSPSPSFSDSSSEDEHKFDQDPSASRPGSPGEGNVNGAGAVGAAVPEADTVTCLWEDCGLVFTHLPTLIEHIHNDHIGVHKSNYTCEWATCSRRSLAQTSRFALISHIRSHTGEKPFTCPRPECDKSFTRSDALAKHMRLQHNISPPLPGRGGNRKRKRDDVPASPPSQNHPPSHVLVPSNIQTAPLGGFNTFKIEPQTPSDFPDDTFLSGTGTEHFPSPIQTNGLHPSSAHPYPHLLIRPTPANASVANPNSSVPISSPHSPSSDTEDALPAHLLSSIDPATGHIMGRPPSLVRYLVMKAKHRYALEQHEGLIEELRVARWELKREREYKEGLLDDVLRMNFGAQADVLITPIPGAQKFEDRYKPPLTPGEVEHDGMAETNSGSLTVLGGK